MPRKPGSVPRDMPRRLTNGGTSALLPRTLRDDRAERRVVGGPVLALAVAGHDQRVGVLVDGDERADDGELVPHLRLQREVLADLHAGDVGVDRLELAAELGRARRA